MINENNMDYRSHFTIVGSEWFGLAENCSVYQPEEMRQLSYMWLCGMRDAVVLAGGVTGAAFPCWVDCAG